MNLVTAELWFREYSKIEKEGLQNVSETFFDTLFGVGGKNKKTGGWAGGGKAGNAQIFIESDQKGYDSKWKYKKDQVRLSDLETKL